MKCEWEITEDYSELDNKHTKVVYGVEESTTVRFTLYSIQSTRMRFDCSTFIWAEKPIKGTRYKTEHSQTNGVYVNGVKVGVFQSTDFACTKNVQLFNRSANYYFIGRIYSFSIFRNGQLQLNFIPALDDTGTPCMFDTVSQTAFYNKGASVEEGGKDFLYKLSVPETKQLPYGYYPLSYLESTAVQYIDTGFTGATVSEIVLDVQNTKDVNNGYAGACTAWDVSDSFYIRHVYDTEQILFVVGTRRYSVNGVAQFTRNKIRFSKTRAVVNGQEIALNADTFVPSSVPFFLFKGGNTYNSFARIFSAQLYDTSNQLVRDFQPCLDDKGIPCMYDFVSGKSFYNKGTESNFLYEIPAEIAMLPAAMALREEKVEYGILTKNGLRHLYHPAKKLYFLPAQLTAYALENGYKPIIENKKPTDGNWTPVWTETEDEIILTWEEINEDEYIKNW